MKFNDYIEPHYVQACELQRGITLDLGMVNGQADANQVRRWMQSYGLFQGINAEVRDLIARKFIEFRAEKQSMTSPLSRDDIEREYSNLFMKLYKKESRSWMSATSKLLWCLYPQDIAIYDSFVHRTLLVLQHFDDDLTTLPHLGHPNRINNEDDIKRAVSFYMTYQDMVKLLQEKHQPTLDNLRKLHQEPYPYDIRIVDKLLWMIGSGNKAYVTSVTS